MNRWTEWLILLVLVGFVVFAGGYTGSVTHTIVVLHERVG